MAIDRCENHPPVGSKHAYRCYAVPVGFPKTCAICGRSGCEAAARLYLNADDEVGFQQGMRVFDIKTNSAKLRSVTISFQTDPRPKTPLP